MERLHTRHDFRRVYEKGMSYASRYLVMFVLPNDLGTLRVGYSVGKRLGKAVTRNYIRRLLRESFRLVAKRLGSPGIDIVWIARQSAVDCSLKQFIGEMEKLLEEARLLRPQE
jgi:ribonuclease P protein component